MATLMTSMLTIRGPTGVVTVGGMTQWGAYVGTLGMFALFPITACYVALTSAGRVRRVARVLLVAQAALALFLLVAFIPGVVPRGESRPAENLLLVVLVSVGAVTGGVLVATLARRSRGEAAAGEPMG